MYGSDAFCSSLTVQWPCIKLCSDALVPGIYSLLIPIRLIHVIRYRLSCNKKDFRLFIYRERVVLSFHIRFITSVEAFSTDKIG